MRVSFPRQIRALVRHAGGVLPDDGSAASCRLLACERVDGSAGHSMARVDRHLGGWRCHGIEILAGPSEVLSCWFQVDLDEDWVTRAVTASAVDHQGERTVSMTADADRRWRVDGVHRPDLDGCVDVDVAATPLTNTFPVRRLGYLAVGQEVTTPVAWVDVLSLSVSRVEQTYRRLADVDRLAAWEYRDDAHGQFVLQVDEDGLVVAYEGFARRVTATGWS